MPPTSLSRLCSPPGVPAAAGAKLSVAFTTLSVPESPCAYIQPTAWRSPNSAQALARQQQHMSRSCASGADSTEIASWLAGWAALAAEQLSSGEAESSCVLLTASGCLPLSGDTSMDPPKFRCGIVRAVCGR
jgi:hypothetical protein